MNEFKTKTKQFKCSLTNKIALIDCTYQVVSGMGSDEVSEVLLKRKCRTDQQWYPITGYLWLSDP